MSIKSHVSLIDLSKQLPFEITQELKNELCFGETLVVSCGHNEGDAGAEESTSDWTCEDTSTESETLEKAKDDQFYEVKDFIEKKEPPEEEDDDDGDFHFYFFPDCSKPPPPQNSKTSIVMVDGMPKINPALTSKIVCTCKKDKTGQCPCFMTIPCLCGAKTKATCTCSELKDICICQPGHPQTVCKCKDADVCTCDPDGKIFPICTCGKIEKPCICQKGKFPSPVCKCKHKPKVNLSDMKSIPETKEDESKTKGENEQDPCECQKPDPKPLCYCLKGKTCTCLSTCVCGIQRTCVCEAGSFEEIPCKLDENKSICSCVVPKVCTCGAQESGGVCKCFPVRICTCKNPESCKCFTTCVCTNPCICDTSPVKPDECICLKTPKNELSKLECKCLCKDKPKKLKRVRAGREGYRWCHEIDPRHTFFDYSYNTRDKFEQKPEESGIEKVHIMGLHDGKFANDNDTECPIHGVKVPPYEKKVRKPSIDCCSSVGGISICVESLGEDKDKFLIQMVSYSGKEGAKSGTKLVSIIDCNLHTMEENRIEHVTKRDITKERRSYMAICENGYYNKVTRICGDKRVTKRFYHTFEQAHNLILEGANVVLLRYFGLRRYRGNVKTETVMMDGTICESVYVCHGVSQGVVNGNPMFVVKVERHIIEPTGFVHQTLTILTLRGYIVSHEWADSSYILHLNPLLPINPERDEIEPHAPLRDRWREDLQLMSDFLDFKATRVSEGGRYVTESGALTGTVRDYLQAILLLRPQDIIHFTRHYFGSVLSALDLPHDEYFDPASKNVRYYFFEQ